MTAELTRLLHPKTEARCNDLPSIVFRQIYAMQLIGVTTLNLCLAAYTETLRAYGCQGGKNVQDRV